MQLVKDFFIFSPVADRYSIDGLKQYASFTISMKLDSTNVVDIYVDSVTQLPVIGKILYSCLFDLILYIPSTIFQLNRDGSSWVDSVLS